MIAMITTTTTTTTHENDKYSALQRTHFFQPIVVETVGRTNTAASSFFAKLGRQISGAWRR